MNKRLYKHVPCFIIVIHRWYREIETEQVLLGCFKTNKQDLNTEKRV